MRLKLFLSLFLVMSILYSCKNEDAQVNFDIQGHRGCRGLLPENTIPAMIKAIEIGVTTLEMDVVISKDNQVLLSHEPFMNHMICSSPSDSLVINEGNERYFNIYEMNYDEVRKYDCGLKGHQGYPNREKMKVYKPLLKDVFDTVNAYCSIKNIDLPFYNIEIKSRPEWDQKYHPGIADYCDLVVGLIEAKEITEMVTIQSFDPRVLKYIHAKYPGIRLVYLSENAQIFNEELESLGFIPNVYSPYYKSLDARIVKELHKMSIKVIPWTVNEQEDMKTLLEYEIDGIISDYPDRVIKLIGINS